MKLKPIYDRIILKEIKKKENKTKSGIILPASVKEMPCEGKIIAIDNDFQNDKQVRAGLKKGDIVLYPSYSAMEFYFEDETYVVIKEEDILCKLEKEEK